jgi:hypothetical protein
VQSVPAGESPPVMCPFTSVISDAVAIANMMPNTNISPIQSSKSVMPFTIQLCSGELHSVRYMKIAVPQHYSISRSFGNVALAGIVEPYSIVLELFSAPKMQVCADFTLARTSETAASAQYGRAHEQTPNQRTDWHDALVQP